MNDLFRQEALTHQERTGDDLQGSLLYLTPVWTRWCGWLLVATLLCLATFAKLRRVHEYASGPGFIQLNDRSVVRAIGAGTITDILVDVGDHIVAGQPLIEIEPADARESAAFGRSSDRTRSSRRSISALGTAVVVSVRVRPGQRVVAGEIALITAKEEVSVVGLLPGRYKPLLNVGMSMSFALVGYGNDYRVITVESVGSSLVSSVEAARQFGIDLSENVANLGDPVVMVRGSIPSRTFDWDGKQLQYSEGLRTRVAVRVQDRALISVLLPRTKGLF